MGSQKYSKEELKKRLTPLQYHVTQEAGTERPYSGISYVILSLYFEKLKLKKIKLNIIGTIKVFATPRFDIIVHNIKIFKILLCFRGISNFTIFPVFRHKFSLIS